MNKEQKGTVVLIKEKKGWMLKPFHNDKSENWSGDLLILTDLYGKYPPVQKEDLYFEKDKNLEEVKEYITNIAKGLGYNLSWDNEVTSLIKIIPPEPIVYDEVDLKWGLWYSHKNDWNNEPEVYEAMEKAFKGECPAVIVHTAPRKEICYGTVTIEKGSANVEFYAVWDSPGDLVPEGVVEDKEEWFKEQITEYFINGEGFYDYDGDNPIGAEIKTKIEAQTFEELMKLVSKEEDELIKQEKENSKWFQEFLNELVKESREINNITEEK